MTDDARLRRLYTQAIQGLPDVMLRSEAHLVETATFRALEPSLLEVAAIGRRSPSCAPLAGAIAACLIVLARGAATELLDMAAQATVRAEIEAAARS